MTANGSAKGWRGPSATQGIQAEGSQGNGNGGRWKGPYCSWDSSPQPRQARSQPGQQQGGVQHEHDDYYKHKLGPLELSHCCTWLQVLVAAPLAVGPRVLAAALNPIGSATEPEVAWLVVVTCAGLGSCTFTGGKYNVGITSTDMHC